MDKHSKIARMVKGIVTTKRQEKSIINEKMRNMMPYSDFTTFEDDQKFLPNKDLRRYF